MGPANRLSLYARTISHLQARQVGYLLLRRLPARGADPSKKVPAPQPRLGVALQTAPLPRTIGPGNGGGYGEFRFLNVSKAFAPGRVDWASPDMARLWRYNLHYFDYIRDDWRPLESIVELVSDWIRSNAPGEGTGWEPYPTSVRIVNWIKLFLREDFRSHVKAAWLDSLYRQAQRLEKNIEYHLLANHLLKNGKALFFAGAFFDGADAERWLRKGSKILIQQVAEQILRDGGHFERSPMYHSIVVEDYLDSLNLMKGCPDIASAPEADFLRDRTRVAMDFLQDIRQPDGSIPLFNDSALGVAPSVDALTEYAGRVIGYQPLERPRGLHVSSRDATGYYVIRHESDMLIVDCGEIGPSYQPGHAHCDTLSFELTLDSRPLIVDSGVFDYEDSEMRRYVRSTRAHNTAMIDRCEQSELWGVFRVAGRARPVHARLEKTGECTARFSGSHDGFARLPGRPVHTRVIEYRAQGIWAVVDTFSGDGEHHVETFVHLHPDLTARVDGQAIQVVGGEGKPCVEIQVLEGADCALENGWYCPEFGMRRQNAVIRLSKSGPLPHRIEYRIVKRTGKRALD
jgi:uncharacterized heparinase superfamily protein